MRSPSRSSFVTDGPGGVGITDSHHAGNRLAGTARHARPGPAQGVSISQWFRERRQTEPDGGRRWQTTRSALPSICTGQQSLCPVSGGAPGRIRTCDTRFRKPMLYPLSYEG